MPRMQVYLPDELYKAVKKGGLPASELLQEAVRAELRRRQLLRETERYVAALSDEVGTPTARQRKKAKALAASIAGRSRMKAS